jgi:hypothetical protein
MSNMNFDRYAGMASAVGIVLILMIVTWLELWGPVNFAKVQQWQTLITGFMALVAAGIAYIGATASVRFDKASAARAERRKRLGVYLRSEHTCIQLSARAKSLAEKTRDRYMGKRTVLLEELHLAIQAPDMAEAWENLEIFPTKTAFRFSQVQSCIRTLNHFTQSQAPNTSWEIGPGIPYSGQMKVTHDLANDLRKACEDVLSEIQPIILAMSEREHG